MMQETDQQIAEAVRYLMNQQELVRAPKREPLPTPITSGGSMMTVAVAASDASPLSKAKADFQCLGVDDQVIIRQAILAAGQEGTVWLSEGYFSCNIDGAATISHFGNIRGLGRGYTYIGVTGSSSATDVFVSMPVNSQLADLTIYGEGGVDAALVKIIGGGDQIVNCYIDNGNSIGWGVWMTGSIIPSIIDRSYIYGDQAAVRASAGFDLTIANSYLEGSNLGIDASGFGSGLVVSGNRIQGGLITSANDCRIFGNLIYGYDQPQIELFSAERVMIFGNELNGDATFGVLADECNDLSVVANHITSTAGAAIFLTACTRPRIEGNTLFNVNVDPLNVAAVVIDGTAASILARGFTLVNNTIDATNANGVNILGAYLHGKVDGNKITRIREHGISIDGLSESTIDGNLVAWTDNLSGTASWDGIILAGDSDRNRVTDNTVVAEIPAGGPAARYGINISAATVNDTLVAGNFVYVAANLTGGAYNDAGTGTMNTWAGAFGDNRQV